MEHYRKPWKEQDPRTEAWFIRWRERGIDGTMHKRSLRCADYRDACDKEDVKAMELRQVQGEPTHPDRSLKGFYLTYMNDMEKIRHLRPAGLDLKRRSLGPFLEVIPTLGQLTRENLLRYRDRLLSVLAGTTVGIRMREIKAFSRWIHFEGHLAANPFVRIELPRQEPCPRFLSDQELSALEHHSSGVIKLIIRMAYMTGMRQNELLQAQWKDIEWKKGIDELTKKPTTRGYLTVWAETAKNRRSRTIALRQELTSLLGTRGKGRIFEGWDKPKLRYAWDQVKEKAAFTGRVRFHDLRHTFCRLYLQGGGTIADLMSITGHQSIVMMRVYAHFETRYKAERMDAMQLPPVVIEAQSTGHRAYGSFGESTGQLQDTMPHLQVIQGNDKKPTETNSTSKQGLKSPLS